MSEKIDISVTAPIEREGKWYFRAMFGPFETNEEASRFALKVGLSQMEEAAPYLGKTETPPPSRYQHLRHD